MFGDGSVRQISPGDSTTLPGWTVSGDSLAWYKDGFTLEGNSLSPHEGNLALNLCDGSVRTCDGSVRVVSEAIPTVPGQQYQVSYLGRELQRQRRTRRGLGGDQGRNQQYAHPVRDGDGAPHGPALDLATLLVQLHRRRNLEHHHLRGCRRPLLQGRGGPTYTGLDDVSIAAVPEASTWALMLLGFAGLGALGLRRGRFART